MDTATYAAAAALPWSVVQRLKRPCGPEAGISAIQTAIEQNSKAFRENWRKHGLVSNRTPTVIRASQQDQMKRDLIGWAMTNTTKLVAPLWGERCGGSVSSGIH